jgi:cytochrome P450
VTFRVKTQGITIDPRFRRKLERWNDGIGDLIEARRGEGSESAPVDALGFVLEHGTGLPPELLRDEISVMIIGGVHPVGTAMSAALDNLCRYPDEGQRVIDEVRAFVGAKGGQPFTLDEVNALEHLDRFADESIRLSPPVHIISRAVKPGKTAVVNGYEIAANTEVVFAPFAVHPTWRVDCAPAQQQFAGFYPHGHHD